MAEIIGYLKEDATHGEETVLDILSHTLPESFLVYVECPLPHTGMERMPDLIILTASGVVVLEVKDWVEVVEADKFHATIRTRAQELRQEKSPVRQAREMAEILATLLQQSPHLLDGRRKLRIPWGYAAVFPNLRLDVIEELRRPWGVAYVLSLGDLQARVVTKRLQATLPHDYTLQREDTEAIRAIVNPSVSISVRAAPKERRVVLDRVQEQIVAEPPPPVRVPEPKPAPPPAVQPVLIPEPAPAAVPEPAAAEVLPRQVERAMFDLSIRLVRGVAGSGKTLVLIQRARYLAAQHPSWQIAVVTFNAALGSVLQASLKGIPNVKVTGFDRLCSGLLGQVRPWHEPAGPLGWIKNRAATYPIVGELGADFLAAELRWIKDVGLRDRDEYLAAERRGRGEERRLERGGARRNQVYDLLLAYDVWLAGQDAFDWADVPGLVTQGIDSGAIRPPCYDAILVDEAQDFAPTWVTLLRRLVRPDGGLIFLVDDPTQSIYRRFSWREKGIPVVGHTRWLRIPYRNTLEIYRAAYEVVHGDEILGLEFEEQLGAGLEPDLSGAHMRTGPRPQVRAFRSEGDEFLYIRSEVNWLLQQGYDAREIAVLHRRSQGPRKLKEALTGTGVLVDTFHALKGLEFEVVFLSQVQLTFAPGMEASPQALSEERRLVYMAMTRARERLYLCYEDCWPDPLQGVLQHADCR